MEDAYLAVCEGVCVLQGEDGVSDEGTDDTEENDDENTAAYKR